MLLERNATHPPVFERSHPLTDSPVRMKDGSTISAEKLARRFYDSPIGQAMYDQPLRYTTNFGYDQEDMRHDLGHDLCPIGHQMELPYHAGKVIEAEEAEGTIFAPRNQEEAGIVMLTALLHDCGEATHEMISEAGLTPVGDIPAGYKTTEDRANEAAVRAFIWETIFHDVDPAVVERMEAIIAHKDTTYLHDLFEAAHLVQTLETSNFAYYRLAEERWSREGEVIDIAQDDAIRFSGLTGIARVAYLTAQKDVKKYYHFAHVRSVADNATAMRYPKHQLIN